MSEFWTMIHQYPAFLPSPWQHVIPTILFTPVFLMIVFLVNFYIVQSYLPTSSAAAKRRASYQLTNMCVNAFLGAFGSYHFWYTLPLESTVDDQVIGWEALYPLSCIQIGYQLWSISMGLFAVKETPVMMAHHVALIMACFMSGFMTIGFRYWSPFFYGVVEISSVPLSMTNLFKDNPKWIQKYPATYFRVRLAFAITFLTFRWVMYAPRKYVLLRQFLWAIQSSDSLPYKVYMSLVWFSSFFLACLQFYWGTLIVKGLANAFLSNRKKEA
jgi:hypothetical protein